MSRVPDTNRTGEAFARPGMDTRTWVKLAVIEAIKIDARGAKADVRLFPTLDPETVAIGGPVMKGGGLHIPYEVDQMVVVGFPSGNANHGPVILGAVWDGGQPAPDIVIAHPDDVALVAAGGRNLRLLAALGRAILAGETVELGDEGATLGVARLGDEVTVTMPVGSIMIENLIPPFMPPLIPNPVPFPVSGVITSASAKVRST